MKKITIGDIFQLVLASAIFLLGCFILYKENITFPGRYTNRIYSIDYPGYVFIASSVISFSIMLTILTFKPKHHMRISRWLLGLALVFFTVGFFV